MRTSYTIRGKVTKGSERGKLLGFPTTNVRLHQKISEGVYASQVVVSGKKYQAATFIGRAKTFNETEYKAENYILNFNQNVYGKWITIKLFKKLRGNKKYPSVQALVKQMKKDVLRTREFFGKYF